MKGDFTRFTHEPTRRYSGVLKQQGRVELDADTNEAHAIGDRIRRVTNIDVIGRTGAPENDAGFGIAAMGEDLAIGRGRMYVEGILCELDTDVTYGTQPHLPVAEPLLEEGADADGRIDLVYLDVWQRHVTAVEDPDLLDPALDGLDTTTRVQTVWQVRVAPDIGSASCAEAVASLPHGQGRLTSGAVGTPDAETPCDVVVAGGYRGIENRLYRVEIHDGGDIGTATWKWSRDNGAVLFAVEEFLTAPDDRIRLRSPGRDRYLALRQDDWVEITDDAHELAGEPGFMARVESVDETTRIVHLDRDVPAGTFDVDRHARVRRWDQVQEVDGDGLRTTAAGAGDLEDGVQVTFGGSAFRTGDWWAFAARTADGAVEIHTDASPEGIAHHYAALARIQWSATAGGDVEATVIDDCRDFFPPLTDICADDVCFDNGNCDLPGAQTVQDAIDQLCAGRDLRWHNRHLHGWGIVCGLQVVCGPDEANRGRRNVTVRSGYALDCDGSDLILQASRTVDLLDRIQALDRLDPNNPILDDGDGEVCLILGRNGGDAGIEVERYVPPDSDNLLEQALEGTLLKDFADGCVKSVLDFLREQTRDDEDRLVGPGRRRLTTLMNLAVQYAAGANGKHVWLSAEEDRILREFYPKLRELLKSRTFCAMFANARPLPQYPFANVEQPTIFGKGGHTRLRMRPNTPLVYTAGSGSAIHVYDAQKREMVAELEFPGGAGVVVQDLAFAPDGRQLHAIASLGGDTLFASADISGTTHKFRPVTVIRDVSLVTLATAGDDAATVLAIGRGRGLYSFNPASPPTSAQPRNGFNAVGHMVVHEPTGLVYATARAEGTPDRYDRIVRMSLKGGSPQTVHALTDAQGMQRTGTDDIAIAPAGQRRFKLYAVADAPTQGAKDVLVYDVAAAATGATVPIAVIPVDAASIRLTAFGSTRLLATMREMNHAIVIDTLADRVLPSTVRDGEDFRPPVQIAPVAAAVDPQGREVYVLNAVSNTITAVPVERLDPRTGIDRDALEKYRNEMLAAYADLLAGLLQYLKDCLCDRLLVDCPTCDEDDRVYLACVSIRDGQVYRVCNFSKRKYVKSFPTVEYWLSLVPVLPLVGVLVEKFCCLVLPDAFGRFEPATQGRDTTLSAARLGSITSVLGRADTKSIFDGLGDRFDLAGRFAGDWMRAPIEDVKQTQPSVRRDEVFGQSLDDARARLENGGATVAGVEKYDPGAALFDAVRPGAVPGKLAPGERVILYQDAEGVVRNWSVVRGTAGTQPAPDLQADLRKIETTANGLREAQQELTATKGEITTLRTDITRVERDSSSALEARDQEVQALKQQLARVQTESTKALADRDAELQKLRTDLARVEDSSTKAIASRDQQIDALRTSSEKLEAEVKTIDRLRTDVEALKRRTG